MLWGWVCRLTKTGKPKVSATVLGKKVTIFLVTLVLLTVLGPFGTYVDFSPVGRFAYWLVILSLCAPVFEVIVPRILYHQKLLRKLSYWARFACAVCIGSVLAYLAVVAVEFYARGDLDITRLARIFVGVLCIGSIASLFRFSSLLSPGATQPNVADINFERIKFFDDYPDLTGSRLRWIAMEDHYARIALEGGERSIHASLTDLARSLENYPGMRIHRSYWVANASMKTLVRNGRRMEIDVGHNVRLPIGGSYLKDVERVFAEQNLT